MMLCGCKRDGLESAEHNTTEKIIDETSTKESLIKETEQTKSGEPIVFTDDLGREVIVHDPKRVAALLGSYADIWYLAGGEICASADDAWEDFALPLSEDAVNLGMTKDLSLELLFAADPDFVLASSNTRGNVEWMDLLEEAGIPTAYFEVSDFEDYLRVLKICTTITGRHDLYEKNGLLVQGEIQQAIERSEELQKTMPDAPTVLSLRASSAFIRAKNSKDNVLGEMLASLGCINIADQEDSLLETLSMEVIIQQDPDYIFFVQQGDDVEGTRKHVDNFISDHPAWGQLTAVKEGRVYMLEKSLYALKPNERWAEAYEELASILYGSDW